MVDSAGNTALERLRAARGFVFDMDGVLYRGDHQLPGVVDLINALEIRSIPYMLATNNSMSTPESYVKKLAKMGIETGPENILTSATATRVYLNEHLPAGSSIYVIGMPPLSEQLFDDSPHVRVDSADRDTAAVVSTSTFRFSIRATFFNPPGCAIWRRPPAFWGWVGIFP